MSSPPFKVKAIFEYTSPHDDDLHFPAGQIITVTEEEDEDWYVGEYVDASGETQEGIFPMNFVEKYEPTAPPRPTRTNRPKKETEAAPAPAPAPAPVPIVEPVKQREPEPETEEVIEPPAAREPPPPAPKAEAYSPPPVVRAVEAPPPQAVAKSAQLPRQSAPPPVSEKPSGNSFRDRINAFNKAAPPPAPFKPGGLSSGSNNFIRKPFVAPPPSKNSYVPPPREPAQPQKIYRRDEDPEIARDELENQKLAEQAGLATSPTGGDGDNQPKTTLKERIALLQKQQMEQAGRHADAAARKEKPKRPTKKRTESHETFEEGDAVALERQNTADTVGTHSMEAVKEESTIPLRRKSTKGSVSGPLGINPRKSFGDGNEADMSGAGDTEQEGISTGRDDSDEKPQNRAPPPPVRAPSARVPVFTHEAEVNDEEGATEQGEHQGDDTEEEEDDVDPEVRRKEELRARMAKMSGRPGMGMMFGAPMPPAPLKKPKKQSTGSSERREYGNDEPTSPGASALPVPMPGMSKVRSPDEIDRQIGHEDEAPLVSSIRPANQVPDVEDVIPDRGPPPPVPAQISNGTPPLPGGRPVPPPIPAESRPNPPPSSSIPMSPSAGSESDDELSERAPTLNLATPAVEPSKPQTRNEGPASPTSPVSRRASYFPPDTMSPISPSSASNKRLSRLPPPIPGTSSASQPQVRAPPPPPPAEAVGRTSTGDHRAPSTPKKATHNESDEEITEYEGDYDTDIVSTATHKEALRTHGKNTSVDNSISARSPMVSLPPSLPPPLPAVPRSGPPPLPSQPPPVARQSSEMPRAAPPPPPPTKMPAPWEDDGDEYDPYRYSASRPNMASVGGHPSFRTEKIEEDIYSASPPKETYIPPPQDRTVPPPPPREAPKTSRGQSRQSVDVHRPSGPGRRSVELSRMSMDSGYVANDVDLAISTTWWTKSKGIPSVYQNRKDILFEFEEHPSTSRSGKALITRELFVLFQDYSQTVITVQYDPKDPKDAKLEQRHEQPPSRLRQDQLEQAHEQFGRPIYTAVTGKKDTVVGDGTPQGLIRDLLKPFSNALLPVGTRAYGAVIYANLANASTTQNDEIRPGDIITLRNTRFQGKHGPMHAKYSMDVGKPDHVGIVAEWDGTKKKVRVWEQGRESKRTKMESFKLDDLRSGEVKIWRVMPRSWVGWHGHN